VEEGHEENPEEEYRGINDDVEAGVLLILG
jgi:hypothetical protein